MKEVHSSTTPNSKIQFHFAFCKFASLTGTCPVIGEGECLLIANYEGLTDTLQVTVLSSQSTAIADLKTDKVQIGYNNKELKVVLEHSYNGNIMVEICDLSGKVCYRDHHQISVQAGEPIFINLSSLPSQLYIARIRTTEESLMKFYNR